VIASANLDLVRSIHAAWEVGDYSSSEWADPQIEYLIVDGPTPGTWKGVSAMNEAWREFASAWADFRVETQEVRELDDERVLHVGLFSASGKRSGLEIGQMRSKGAGLWHLRGGKVRRLVIYWQAERAFADLGLAPEGDSQR
jgi:ketosteroid isomerase-like protein